jgi:hypothetical protein
VRNRLVVVQELGEGGEEEGAVAVDEGDAEVFFEEILRKTSVSEGEKRKDKKKL